VPASELCEVVITAPDPEWLRVFSRQLVEDRLCASAHNFQPIQSIYRWHGEIYEQHRRTGIAAHQQGTDTRYCRPRQKRAPVRTTGHLGPANR